MCEIISVCWYMIVELSAQDLSNDWWEASGPRCGFLPRERWSRMNAYDEYRKCMEMHW